MSVAAPKRAAAKRVPNPPNPVDPPPAIAPAQQINDGVPGVIRAANETGSIPNSLWIREDKAREFGIGQSPEVPVVTPGRIVLVTLEPFPSHIVTRPAIVITTSEVDRTIAVHVFWDLFRDGTWAPYHRLDRYSEKEELGTWRFPPRV